MTQARCKFVPKSVFSTYRRTGSVAVVAAMFSATCAGDPPALHSFVRPDIGTVDLLDGDTCVAALVAPRAAITAAHCVGFRSYRAAAMRSLGEFSTLQTDDTVFTVAVIEVRSFGTRPGRNDIALLRLAESVTTRTAYPTGIAPPDDTGYVGVASYGFGQGGCGGFEMGVRRVFAFYFGDEVPACSGDSGGPAIIGQTGPMFALISGVSDGRAVFADVAAHREEIASQIAAWGDRIGDRSIESTLLSQRNPRGCSAQIYAYGTP